MASQSSEEDPEMETDEPDTNKNHVNDFSNNSSLSFTSPSTDKSIDITCLQSENQKLVQQLDNQKHELHNLAAKIEGIKEEQASHYDTLILLTQFWKLLVDDLVFLGLRAGGTHTLLETFNHTVLFEDKVFLCGLMGVNFRNADHGLDYVEILSSRKSSTLTLMGQLKDVLYSQKTRVKDMTQKISELPVEGINIELREHENLVQEEATNLQEVIEILLLKRKNYSDEIRSCKSAESMDQSKIKLHEGELEELMAELEERRRKFVNLKMQKDWSSTISSPSPCIANGNASPENFLDRSKGVSNLRDLIEEQKDLAADRCSEVQAVQHEVEELAKELKDLENEIKDDKHVYSSRLYNLVNDQLQHWSTEVEKFRSLMDSLEAERLVIAKRDKEVSTRLDTVNAAKYSVDNNSSRIHECELQLQKCIKEKNDLEIKLEEVLQDSGHEDVKSEFQLMISALSREMSTMDSQLNRWNHMAQEADSLREQSKSLLSLLSEKENEYKCIASRCKQQTAEIKNLKTLREKLQKETLELQVILEMHGQEFYDCRDIQEIRESELRAFGYAKSLRRSLDEHNLELRVKAANEAESECEKRLSAAEAEISQLRGELEAVRRDVQHIQEAIRSKDKEAETYILEIEIIGQAYDEMQTQNKRLLQYLAERDDFNIKLVSDSVKNKHAQTLLLSENEALAKQLQQLNESIGKLIAKIDDSEDQLKAHLKDAIEHVKEDTHLTLAMETAEWELMVAEKELKWLRHMLNHSEKEHEQIKKNRDEIQMELNRESKEMQKLEEELVTLNGEIEELSAGFSEAAILHLQEEIKACKSIIKCSICSDRLKEVVIVKCYHLFCKECIQKNLEIRHRKCPACGTTFGQNDVRLVSL